MNDSNKSLKFKNHFKNLNFYSMPNSILFVVRKRLNLVFFFVSLVGCCLFSII